MPLTTDIQATLPLARFRKRLLAAMVAINILAIVATGIELAHNLDHFHDRAGATAKNLSNTLEVYLGNLVGRMDQALLATVAKAEGQLDQMPIDQQALADFVARQRRHLPEVDILYVAKASGDARGVVNGKPIAVNLSDRQYFQDARNSRDDRLIVGLPVQSRIDGSWTWPFVRRVNGPRDEFAGVAIIAIRLERISDMLAGLDLGKDGVVAIRSDSLGTLLHYPADPGIPLGNKKTSLEFEALFTSGVRSGSYRAVAATDRVERLIAFKRLDHYPLHVVVGISLEEARSAWLRESVPALALLTIFVLISILLTHAILRALQRQHEVTQALVAKESHLRQLQLAVDQNPNSIVITNTEGEIEYVNQAFTRSSGYTAAEVLGKTPRLLKSELTPQDTYREMWHTLTEGKTWRGEIVNRRKDGSLYTEDEILSPIRQADGRISHFLAIKEDITASKNMHSRLEELGRYLQDILTAASEVSIIATDAEGLITVFNRGAERMLGYAASDMIGKQSPAIIHLADEVAARGAELSRLFGYPVEGFRVFVEIAEHEGSERREWTYVTHTGEHLTVSLVITAMRDGGGSVTGYLGIAQDITERKQAEAELLRAAHAAAAASRAKSQFLANMSHEIRTPMNGVIGMTQLILMTELSDEQREYAETIRSSAESLLTIINDILDFSKVEAGKLNIEYTAFALRALQRHLHEFFAPQIESKGLTYREYIADDVPERLLGDPGRLRQILTNLIGNAVKFTQYGSIAVEIRCSSRTEDGAWLSFVVRDTGIGMDEFTQQRLFSPFYQADASTTRRFGGTGLGLSISQRLAELMGGTIEVESQPDEGSAFIVQLPFALDTAEPEAARQPAQTPLLSAAEKPRVLIVEDNAINQQVLAQMLRKLDLDAKAAANGLMALELLRQESFSVVLMDCQMPVMDGFEATRRIRAGDAGAHNRGIRIVALTANAMTGDRDACLAAGMDEYLAKPVVLDDLAAHLRTAPGVPGPAPALALLPPTTGDTFVVATFMTNMMQDSDLAKAVAVSTLEDMPRYLDEFDAALAAGQIGDACRAMHTLKNLSAQVGGAAFAATCRDVEITLRNQSAPDAAARAALTAGHQGISAALRAWLDAAG